MNVGAQLEPYLIEKRNEIMWALSTQGHSTTDIGRIFNISKSRTSVILRAMPKGYTSKWVKRV